MNVHEFQAKQLFAQFGVPVPRGKEITSPEAATAWARSLAARPGGGLRRISAS